MVKCNSLLKLSRTAAAIQGDRFSPVTVLCKCIRVFSQALCLEKLSTILVLQQSGIVSFYDSVTVEMGFVKKMSGYKIEFT